MPTITVKSANTTESQRDSKTALLHLEKVRSIVASFSKLANAKAIYAKNNPTLINFSKIFDETVRAFFRDRKELVLTIQQYEITWNQEVVYESQDRRESIAFLLYKDGVGEITIDASVTPAELDQFADLIQKELHNPTIDTDIVTKLWSADFKSIFYRVLDEYADSDSSDGQGAGAGSPEQVLLANDHQPMLGEGDGPESSEPGESIDAYIGRLITKDHPDASLSDREEQTHQMLTSLFTFSGEALEACRQEFVEENDGDNLFDFFNVMVEFSRMKESPADVRDALDAIERLVSFFKEEADVRTLIRVYETLQQSATGGSGPDVDVVLDKIVKELGDKSLLVTLGRATHFSRGDTRALFHYYRLVGKSAVPALCELLGELKGAAAHAEACHTLIAIAGDDIESVISHLDTDDPSVAQDAVYLLLSTGANDVPKAIRELLSNAEPQVREKAIGFLALIEDEEAVSLLMKLMDDDYKNVRMKALKSVENVKKPPIIEKVCTLCFDEEEKERSMDELELMFRIAGRLAGETVVPRIKQMIGKKRWFGFDKERARQNKLLAINALRHIPGVESMGLLGQLSKDKDGRVSSTAQQVLRVIADGAQSEMQETADQT